MVTALAEIGAPIAWAEQWPRGAPRFSTTFDSAYESVVPLSRDPRAAIDVYLRRHPKAGDVALLPSNVSRTSHAERFSPAAGYPGRRTRSGQSSRAARRTRSDARSRRSVAICRTSTSWLWRDGGRRLPCARATSTRTDKVCFPSWIPPNRARSRATVAQTRHKPTRSDCTRRA